MSIANEKERDGVDVESTSARKEWNNELGFYMRNESSQSFMMLVNKRKKKLRDGNDRNKAREKRMNDMKQDNGKVYLVTR